MKKEVNTVKDLMENEKLNQFVTEDLEDFDADTPVSYEVWAIGYDEDEIITDSEMFVAEFDDPDEAVTYIKNLTLADIVHKAAEDPVGVVDYEEVKRISVEVETVVDEKEEGTMNVGTIYKRDLWVDGEYGSEEDVPGYDEDIVTTCAGDYELLDDGTLKIKASFMQGFNKNDIIRIKFIDENDTCALPYKIMSKVIYEDGDYFHCELTI